ncbi:Lachesin precursor, putative [Gryllus bimaculatus]|nr:Lachesin precursor, putative [Gryllus bimaculatus]
MPILASCLSARVRADIDTRTEDSKVSLAVGGWPQSGSCTRRENPTQSDDYPNCVVTRRLDYPVGVAILDSRPGRHTRKQHNRRTRLLDNNHLEIKIPVNYIAYKLKSLTDGPRFIEPIPNVTVALGRDASLPCVVENLGSYKVAWIHIDRQMILTIHRHVIARVPRFSVSHDNHKTWLLHVTGVQQEDRGYYMCQWHSLPRRPLPTPPLPSQS